MCVCQSTITHSLSPFCLWAWTRMKSCHLFCFLGTNEGFRAGLLCSWRVLKAHSFYCSLLRKDRIESKSVFNFCLAAPASLTFALISLHPRLYISRHTRYLIVSRCSSDFLSICLTFISSLCLAWLRATETREGSSPAKGLREDKQCYKLQEWSLPLRLSVPSSVKPFMKAISLWPLATLPLSNSISPPLYLPHS